MAIPAYAWFKDDQGNEIKGSVVVQNREGSVEVLEFNHEVRIPTDADTGALTGVRKHEPLIFQKAFDSLSPYLYKAVANGQTFKEIVIKWFRINDSGSEVEYFRHTLKDVKITSVKPLMHNTKDLDRERYPHLEEVCMRYGEITWTYADGNIEFKDSWVEGR